MHAGTVLGKRHVMFAPSIVLALALCDQPAVQDEQAKPPDPQAQRAEAKEPPTPPHTGIRALGENLVEDVKKLPAKQNLYLAAIGGGLALAVHPADQNVNASLISHYDGVNKAFAAGKYIGNTPEQVALSVGTYAFGRIFDQPKVSHLGMDLLQAQILTEIGRASCRERV